MTDLVYPVDGTFEDWAYGGWEKKLNPSLIPKCTNADDFETDYDLNTLRSATYLIETAYSKNPLEKFLGDDGTGEFGAERYVHGHIPINLNISLSLIDLAAPYVK
jgi:hypothetical protein